MRVVIDGRVIVTARVIVNRFMGGDGRTVGEAIHCRYAATGSRFQGSPPHETPVEAYLDSKLWETQ